MIKESYILVKKIVVWLKYFDIVIVRKFNIWCCILFKDGLILLIIKKWFFLLKIVKGVDIKYYNIKYYNFK